MLRMFKRFGFKKDELITVHKGYIRPLLVYVDVVWNLSLTLTEVRNDVSGKWKLTVESFE